MLLFFLYFYIWGAVVAAFIAITMGPPENWDNSFKIPFAIVALWPIGLPLYIVEKLR